MAKFCKYCGRQLREGEVCNCTRQNQGKARQPGRPAPGQPPQNAYGNQRGGAPYQNTGGRMPNAPGAQGGGYPPNGGGGRMSNGRSMQGGYPPNGGGGRMPNSPGAQGGYAQNRNNGGHMPNSPGGQGGYPPNGGGGAYMPNSSGTQGENYQPNGYGGNDFQNAYNNPNPGGDYGANGDMKNVGDKGNGGGMIGLAIASMVLGIISLLLSCCIPYLPVFLAVIGAVLGGVSLAGHRAGKGMAIAGLVCSIIAMVPSVILIITGASLMASLGI